MITGRSMRNSLHGSGAERAVTATRCLWAVLSLLPLVLYGCATSTGTQTPTPVVDTSGYLTGNWQGTVTASTGSPVTSFAGSVTETSSVSSAGQYTMALLQFQGPCFTASPLLPMQGDISAGALGLDSYTVNGQTVHIMAAANSTGTALTGSYSVQGGCASGATGSFSAARYPPLTGTYSGSVAMSGSAAVKAVLTLTQGTDPTGSGTFLLTGTLSLAGTGCSLSATAASATANAVHGSQAAVTLNATDGSGGIATVSGTFDAGATVFTPAVFSVQGGSCAGTYTSGPLTK
jgi:hypothetical protein